MCFPDRELSWMFFHVTCNLSIQKLPSKTRKMPKRLIERKNRKNRLSSTLNFEEAWMKTIWAHFRFIRTSFRCFNLTVLESQKMVTSPKLSERFKKWNFFGIYAPWTFHYLCLSSSWQDPARCSKYQVFPCVWSNLPRVYRVSKDLGKPPFPPRGIEF